MGENKPFNILITSSGRRTSLLLAFKEAVKPLGGKVLAGDIDGLAPTLFLADRALELTPVKNRNYIPHLYSIVEKEAVDLIVPTIDTELGALSESREKLLELGCFPLVSDSDLMEITFDKWKTFEFFSSNGVDVPLSWLPESLCESDLPDKLFIKPRKGSASQHTYKAEKSTIGNYVKRVPDPIIQEELEGPEVTVDALLDFQGKLIHYVPRIRIRTLAGESIEGETIDDRDLRPWLCRNFELIGSKGGIGPMTLQFFITDRGPVLTEVNPRFGGGFPLANAAGGRYPEWIVQMLNGAEIKPRIGEYKKGLYMTRHHAEIFTERKVF
jgi:carbamoyl-phosphate synthase large subunit